MAGARLAESSSARPIRDLVGTNQQSGQCPKNKAEAVLWPPHACLQTWAHTQEGNTVLALISMATPFFFFFFTGDFR